MRTWEVTKWGMMRSDLGDVPVWPHDRRGPSSARPKVLCERVTAMDLMVNPAGALVFSSYDGSDAFVVRAFAHNAWDDVQLVPPVPGTPG